MPRWWSIGERGGGVALRVEVDHQHPQAVLGERGGHVHRGRGLADAALLVGDHHAPGCCSGRGSGSRSRRPSRTRRCVLDGPGQRRGVVIHLLEVAVQLGHSPAVRTGVPGAGCGPNRDAAGRRPRSASHESRSRPAPGWDGGGSTPSAGPGRLVPRVGIRDWCVSRETASLSEDWSGRWPSPVSRETTPIPGRCSPVPGPVDRPVDSVGISRRRADPRRGTAATRPVSGHPRPVRCVTRRHLHSCT